METFTDERPFAEHPGYAEDRREALAALDLGDVDEPIRDIVVAFNELPHCFTLQCCYGHFVTSPEQDTHTLERIPVDHAGTVEYRIAYLTLCLEESTAGRALRDALGRVPEMEPSCVQFGSADWFWEQWPNSYVLQVEPAAHRFKDRPVLGIDEALRTQRVRDLFFEEVRALLVAETARGEPGVVPE